MSKKKNNKDPATSDEEDEVDLRAYIKQLHDKTEKTIADSVVNIRNYVDQKYTALKGFLDQNTAEINKVRTVSLETKTSASEILKRVDSLEERVHHLEEVNKELTDELKHFRETEDVQAIQINTLKYRLEDQTNRNCRRTLIVRGIPEVPNEKWNDTKPLLASNIAKLCKLPEDGMMKAIERAHRSKMLKNDKKAGRRDIHVLFFDWNIAQEVLTEFIKHGRGQNVYIEQRYGPDTTWRRNKAKKERRTLLDQGTITCGFVDFPAVMLVKYKEEDQKYIKHKDFSKLEVVREDKD